MAKEKFVLVLQDYVLFLRNVNDGSQAISGHVKGENYS